MQKYNHEEADLTAANRIPQRPRSKNLRIFGKCCSTFQAESNPVSSTDGLRGTRI